MKDLKVDLAKSSDTRKALDNTFMVEWVKDMNS